MTVLKILLITINSNTIVPPLGQYLISAYYYKTYPTRDIDIKVKYFENYQHFRIMKLIASEKPDLIGLGCYVWNIGSMKSLCKEIKGIYPSVKIVLGGPSISYTDEELLKMVKTDMADYLIVGEGERAFAELINNLFDKTFDMISEIPGIIGKNTSGGIFSNIRTNDYLIEIDDLPNPYEDNPKLVEETRKFGFASLETARGCPFRCAYCITGQSAFQPSLKQRAIRNIISDITYLRDIGLNKIIILDPTFNFDISRSMEILKEIIALKSDFNFMCEIKVELLNDEIISLMREAGFTSIEIGLQTSNLETLKRINRYHDREKFIQNIDKLKVTNMFMVVDLIIGLPEETLDDFCNSLDFCYNLGDIKITCGMLKLYPNTSLYNNREKYKYEYDSQRMNRVVKSSTMTKEEIDFAESMINPISVFWSHSECDEYLRSYVRTLCEKYYKNVFSDFIKEITVFLRENGVLEEVTLKLPVDKRKLVLDRFFENKIGK